MKKLLGKQKGITLAALVITIIVLIILAGISLSALSDNGLINKAIKSKETKEINEEKEIIQIAAVNAEHKDANKILTAEGLKKELWEYDAEVYNDIESLIVKFNDRYYEVMPDGNVEKIETIEPKELIIQCVDSKNNIILEEKHNVLRNKFLIDAPQVAGYEAIVDKVEGEIEENTTIQHSYYKVFGDDTTLVFTGLDSKGKITSVESEIVSYMIGNGTTTNGNGFVDGVIKAGIKGVIRIPETYNGKSVTHVSQYAFTTASIVIKASTGDSVTTIQQMAWDRCSGLEEFVLGKEVASIGSHVFRNCAKVKKIIVQSENIMNFVALSGCTNLSNIEISSSNNTYKVENGVIYSKDGKVLYFASPAIGEEFIIPDGVEKIYSYAVSSKTNLKKVVISDSVKEISSQAFEANGKLEEIIIGKNVSSIGSHAFKNCTSLKKIILKSEKKDISFACFSGCSNFNQIEVNNDNPIYTVIDNMLYSKDGKILYLVPTGREGELTIPVGVERIFKNAVAAKSKIKKVVISDTVTTIDWQAFDGDSNIEEIIIGKNVTSIGGHAFRNCSKLKKIIFKSEKKDIVFNCFSGCTAFTEIEINSDNPTYTVNDNMLYSKDGKILYLVPSGKEGELIIPDGVERIFQSSAVYKPKIKKVVISDTVKTIDGIAFDGNTNFEEIIVGEKVSSIGSHCFRNCSKLKTVIIKSSIISNMLTSQTACGNLINSATTIYIRDNITKIGSYVLENYTIQESDKDGYVKYVKK